MRRGFTLLNMTVALGFVGLLALLSWQLVRSSTQVIEVSNRAAQRAMQWEIMIETLRADVWGAGAMDVTDHEAALHHDAVLTTWTIDGSTIQRRSAEQARQWKDIGAGATLSRHAGGLMVRSKDGHTHLVCPVLADRGGTR